MDEGHSCGRLRHRSAVESGDQSAGVVGIAGIAGAFEEVGVKGGDEGGVAGEIVGYVHVRQAGRLAAVPNDALRIDSRGEAVHLGRDRPLRRREVTENNGPGGCGRRCREAAEVVAAKTAQAAAAQIHPKKRR